jgi:hypothetical protein
VEAFLWNLRSKEHQDAFMYPRSCMNTKVLVGNPQTQNIDAFLGDLDMQRNMCRIFTSRISNLDCEH